LSDHTHLPFTLPTLTLRLSPPPLPLSSSAPTVTLVFFTNVLAADQAQPPLKVLDLLAQELPFLIIAVTGVGLFIRRNGAETAVRLGVVTPIRWQITLALAAAGGFSAAAQGAEALSDRVGRGGPHAIAA